MTEDQHDAPPEPIAPAPADVAPSATGLVVGDGSEVTEAPPSARDSDPEER